MATITTRSGKGSPLTNAELDANFTNLNSDKLETADASVTNSREWTATTVTQAEAEAGTATTRRAWTAQRVWQAIASWALSGNVNTATTLQTARNINGTSFNGSAAITTANWGTSRNLSVGGTSKAVDGSAAVTWTEAEIAANTAVTLKTARAINGTSFNGSAAITTTNWGTSRDVTIGGTAKSVDGSANVAWAESEIAANTAVTLKTARAINGTDFNGSAAITTANWGTARTITIGATGKSVSGSGNVSWTLAEIGAADRALTLTAGNGLSGGGDLTAGRTFTLGTPTSCTATSTNSVAVGAHTHAIDSTIARSAITITAGTGLSGGGNLTANRTISMDTTAGNIGTYAYCTLNTSTALSFGGTVAGSSLTPVSHDSGGTTVTSTMRRGATGSAQSGTWRLMGHASNNDASTYPAGLFMRIS
jgi:hypothetical protein